MTRRSRWAVLLTAILFASSALAAISPPEFFGSYIVEGDRLIEVSPTTQKLLMRGNLNDAFRGYEQVQGSKIDTLQPKLILYQQHVASSAVALSRLAWVTRGATENMMTGQQQSIDVNLWVPVEDIKLRVKPMDDEGMYLFQPSEKLATGYYAIHYGGLAKGVAIGSGGDVYLLEVRHPRQDEIVSLIERFVQYRDDENFEALADLAYTLDRSANPVPASASTMARTTKVRKYLVGGSLRIETIKEQTDESGTFYRVETPIEGKVFSFTVSGMADTGPHAFYVRDVDGEMKVFVNGQHWMFQ